MLITNQVIMQVSAINNTSINFQGLWRKSTQKTDFDTVMQIKKMEETYYYHPFSDETAEQIAQVVQSHSSANIEEKNNQYCYYIKECKLCSKLPIDTKSYENYTQLKKLSQRAKNIHRIVLGKYTNPDFGVQQSAVNEEIAKKFKVNA